MANDLGDQPTPETEPGDPNPGGVDALSGDDGAPVSPDLSPEDNPAVEDAAPAEIKQPEESNEGASTDGASEPEKESPA